jgi:L-seryl-tRNA(Ser) seleniumtransferase
MPEPSEDARTNRLRSLPSVDELLRTPEAAEIANATGQARALVLAREVCELLRKAILENAKVAERLINKETALMEAALRMTELFRSRDREGVVRVINATGVIVHTNLGRSSLSENARRAAAEAAGYCTLEYDLGTGKRGRRGAGAERMICDLTGAEGAVIVNNCAAAAFLTLTVLAGGREVIVSRGELVEIGGDFRVPDVLAQSGATMREVGTTNRTKLRDYETALSPATAMILRVHPSNYRVVGFTETPRLADLADLAHRSGVILFEDAGSGAMTDLSGFGLSGEPLIASSLKDGADLVSFSGDKLLGGPQAGIIAGKSELVEKIRRHPLYRALRVDKIVYAALEATLHSYLKGKQFEEIPTLRMLAASEAEIKERANALVERVAAKSDVGLRLEVVSGESVIGGGSAPDFKPGTALIAIEAEGATAELIESRLRENTPPVIARIADDRVVMDLRTVDPSEEADVIEALVSVGQPLRPAKSDMNSMSRSTPSAGNAL